MPLQWRLQVLGAQLSQLLGKPIRFVEADLYRLEKVSRSSAIDALTRGDSLPFAILDDRVISTGRLDADVIAREVERHIAGA